MNNKSIVIILGMIIVILALILGAYVFIFKGSVFGWSTTSSKPTSTNTNYNTPTTDQVKNGQTIKSQSISSGGKSTSDQPTSPTPIPGSSQKNVTVSITSLHQNSTSELQVGALIGAVVNSGTCTLKMTSPGQPTITRSSGVQASSTTSFCQGFDVTGVPSGVWQVTVSFNNTNLAGSATSSKEVQ